MTEYKQPSIATDIIIKYDGMHEGERVQGYVLIKRKNPPIGLALPGGFAEYGLTLEENAIKEAKEETGLEIILKNPERPLCVHSDPNRDPRGHVISVTYVAEGRGTLKAGDDAKEVYLVSFRELADMTMLNKTGKKYFVFDHDKIINKYLCSGGEYD